MRRGIIESGSTRDAAFRAAPRPAARRREGAQDVIATRSTTADRARQAEPHFVAAREPASGVGPARTGTTNPPDGAEPTGRFVKPAAPTRAAPASQEVRPDETDPMSNAAAEQATERTSTVGSGDPATVNAKAHDTSGPLHPEVRPKDKSAGDGQEISNAAAAGGNDGPGRNDRTGFEDGGEGENPQPGHEKLANVYAKFTGDEIALRDLHTMEMHIRNTFGKTDEELQDIVQPAALDNQTLTKRNAGFGRKTALEAMEEATVEAIVSERIAAAAAEHGSITRSRGILHTQTEDILGTVIDDLPPGTKLPSEQTMSSLLNEISRNTLHNTLDALQDQGKIIKRQGLGAFVAGDPALDTQKNVPLYQRIAGELGDAIREGQHAPDSLFLTKPDIAEQYGVSNNTAHRILEELRQLGLITTQPGVGSFVVHELPSEGTRVAPEKQKPKYLEIAEEWAREIKDGNVVLGSQFFSEVELTELYGVSRNTARAAMKDLQSQGLITIQHGAIATVTQELPPEGARVVVDRAIPLYVQIADEWTDRIRRLEVPLGSRLPTENELIALHGGVSRGPIRNALEILRQRDLITTQIGVGSFVTDTLPPDDRVAHINRRMPRYLQIAADLERQITEREIATGSTLTSVDKLALEHGVSYSTIERAYSELRARGLITKRGETMFQVVDTLPEKNTRVAIERDIPLYLQIADAWDEAIYSGEVKSGSRFPTKRQLAEQYNMSHNTAEGVIKELKARGLVTTGFGRRGTVIAEELPEQGTRIAVQKEVPLYRQIADDWTQKIIDGEVGLGSKFYTEDQLCALHGVKKNTVRQALKVLQARGLISTKPGAGSTVTKELPRQKKGTN